MTLRNFKRELQDGFLCPKCHARGGGVVHDVRLAAGSALPIPVPGPRYMAVSCPLCGFTEFYNVSAVARDEAPAVVRGRLAADGESV